MRPIQSILGLIQRYRPNNVLGGPIDDLRNRETLGVVGLTGTTPHGSAVTTRCTLRECHVIACNNQPEMKTSSQAGKAAGPNRQYQIQCRNVLQHERTGLLPYSGDGIDVQFLLGGTTWTLDVALRTQSGEIVVAECRRRTAAAKQDEVASLAYKIELLRKHLNVPVAGAFFVKTALQLGAVRVGNYEGITTAVLTEGGDATDFTLAYHRYDHQREERLRHFVLGAAPGSLSIFGADVQFTVTRKS